MHSIIPNPNPKPQSQTPILNPNPKPQSFTIKSYLNHLSLISGFSLRRSIMPEPILSPALHIPLIAHSSVTLASSLSGLQRPVITSGSGVWIGAFRAGLFLDVVGLRSASSAGRVDLCVALTEALSTFAFHHLTLY